MSDDVIAWLLQGDPSVRWQTERDLVGADAETWSVTRRCVEFEGMGAQLLSLQDPEGTWANGLYSPKWTSTTYTLILLRRLGLSPTALAARRGCEVLLDQARWVDGGVSYWKTHRYAEKCVNAMVLSVGSYFRLDDERLAAIATMLIDGRLEDGGWNCLDHEGAKHSSMHTTISALEGIHLWWMHAGDDRAVDALRSGEDFLLRHGLFRSERTGDVIDEAWLAPHFPPRWHYDVLRGLEHFHSVDRWDSRLTAGCAVVADRGDHDRVWPRGPGYGGHTFFPIETSRRGGRWNTLRARRVLAWADARMKENE